MDQPFAGFKRTEVAGVPVLWLPDTRFKTFCIHLAARRTLDERAAARSVLPVLLMQGTANYPDGPALARRMESLYGAMVAPGSSKEGEVHVLRFGLDCGSARRRHTFSVGCLIPVPHFHLCCRRHTFSVGCLIPAADTLFPWDVGFQ